MGIPSIQSSTWAWPPPRAWQCGFVTSRSRACTLALASEIDFASVLKDAEGPAYLSFLISMCSLRLLGLSIVGSLGSIDR